MKKTIVLYGSSRDNGNTECLTNTALDHAKDLEVTKFYLRELTIHPIQDERHSGRPFPAYNDDYYAILQVMLEADLIVFATPVYWYNMSTSTKTFIDRFTESLRNPAIDLKKVMANKQMYVICTGANSNEAVVLPMIEVFKLVANYFKMEFKGYLWANADHPGDIEKDLVALERARQFFAHL